MSGSLCRLIAILCAVMIGYSQNGRAQDTPANERTERAEATKQFAYFDALAKHFTARLASDVPLERSGDSLLNWTIDRSWHGSYYVWTANGRPAIVGCFLADSEKSDRRRAFIELHTMIDEPLTPLSISTGAISAGQTYEWNPVAARNSTLPLTDVAAPAKQEQTRRLQMREIAQQFELTMFREAGASEAQEELRMLARPLYRYPATTNGSLEGAIYAFVTAKGTDPEFLLAVECDPRAAKRWWIARPLRSCTRRLELRRQGVIVWSCDEYSEAHHKTKLSERYMILTLVETSTKNFEAIRERMIKTRSAIKEPP